MYGVVFNGVWPTTGQEMAEMPPRKCKLPVVIAALTKVEAGLKWKIGEGKLSGWSASSEETRRH